MANILFSGSVSTVFFFFLWSKTVEPLLCHYQLLGPTWIQITKGTFWYVCTFEEARTKTSFLCHRFLFPSFRLLCISSIYALKFFQLRRRPDCARFLCCTSCVRLSDKSRSSSQGWFQAAVCDNKLSVQYLFNGLIFFLPFFNRLTISLPSAELLMGRANEGVEHCFFLLAAQDIATRRNLLSDVYRVFLCASWWGTER